MDVVGHCLSWHQRAVARAHPRGGGALSGAPLGLGRGERGHR
jgi:hypothetical protein